MASFHKVRKFFLIFSISLFFFAGRPFPSSDKATLIGEMDLADWGFDDPADVGYLSIGIIHKKDGDEMVVYDVRENRPVVEQPSRPKSRIPFFRKDVFLLDDFYQGNTNRLGGYFGKIFRAPSESHVTVVRAKDGRRSLRFTFDRKSTGFSGFWIHLFDFKKPPVERIFLDATPFRYITFAIRGEEGGERLALQVADQSWEKKEDSLKIGDVGDFLPTGNVRETWQRAWVPLESLPEQIAKKELASLVFLAKAGEGRVYIGDIAFTTAKDVSIPQPAVGDAFRPSPHRGMWVWNTKDVIGDDGEKTKLVDFCRQNGITEIFLQLPYASEELEGKTKIFWDEAQVASLISRLHRTGIRVHALDGDPRYALKEWHRHVLAAIESVILFNKSVEPEQRFDGIRYDNEPYVLPYFAGIQKEAIIEQYLELLRRSQESIRSAGLEFGVDIPFWFDQENEFFEPIVHSGGRPLTECILDIVDNIGIMDYRTDAYGADGVVAHALGELGYASAKGKKVFIGLETAALPDETILEFVPGKGPSKIRLEKTEGTRVLLRWAPEVAVREAQGVRVLYQLKKTFVPAGKLTFAGKSIQELAEVMEQAEAEFHKYPGFYGYAIHYYRSFRALSGLKAFPVLFF